MKARHLWLLGAFAPAFALAQTANVAVSLAAPGLNGHCDAVAADIAFHATMKACRELIREALALVMRADNSRS